jgi:AraC-like DNA-binding protein
VTEIQHVENLVEDESSALSIFRNELKSDVPSSENKTAWIHRCYRILANQHLFPTYAEVISELLDTACRRFKCDTGFVFKLIADDVFELCSFSGELPNCFIGQHVTTQNFSLLADQRQLRTLYLKNLSSDVKLANLAYTERKPGAYMGAKMALSGRELACICLFSQTPFSGEFEEEGVLFLELMAEGIAGMMESQKARVQRKSEDLAVHASGSMKSLEDYQQMAKLPDSIGVIGRVVDVLKKRIGEAPLGIDNIASELNLSKRTLQRRLQQQGVSFAELRDVVRFHYSIDYLVSHQISIDRISSTLDFSDRTSFTNAFKRWTGLSPSTFRKVFRDYV